MEADKISQILEVQLKTLGLQLRRKILKHLYLSAGILSFSSLEKKVLDPQESKNLSFHLKKLKKCNLISMVSDGYKITSLGIHMYETIRSMEDLLNERNKTIMIRTSKYSKEEFNLNKIESYLITEGKIESFQAKKIANIVKQRLSKTSIKYLTAPLMREYINAILIEHNLEDVRHRLTRLGTPPFDVKKLFIDQQISPDDFIHRLGSDVSEQYLLLNVLPKNLADLYLSGKIILLNLNQWHLKPRSLYINPSDLTRIAERRNLFSALRFYKRFIEFGKLNNYFLKLCSFFSGNIFLDAYNQQILYNLCESLDQQEFNEFFSGFAELYGQNTANLINTSGTLTFGFNYSYNKQKHKKFFDNFSNYDLPFCSHLSDMPLQMKGKSKFHFFMDYNSLQKNGGSLDSSEILKTNLSEKFLEKCVFYNAEKPSFVHNPISDLSSSQIGANFPNSRIILDKMFINLQSIAHEADSDDATFFTILNKRLHEMFQFFQQKELIIKKKLANYAPWKKNVEPILNNNSDSWINDSLKSISFINLNSAVKTHCGIELDRVSASEDFALKLISFMQRIIAEKNNSDNSTYFLSAPHKLDFPSEFPVKFRNHDSFRDIIRKESKLTLHNKFRLYDKFQTVLEGGIGFPIWFNTFDDEIQQLIKQLMDFEINTFYFTKR
ncbi:MAG: anaerobic ribonucleoside-triphosphate reductase [Promethearchaeia archaeon]